ncbi:hypothetical protein AB0J72_08170 [Dactylosporangium sp. NPDC049742]|uniref:hypothetical protein n=1 Tax=Dactylosporangium sp. NPDC049742 TaxID=3154737 RepID=UPI0034375C3B
MTRSVRGRSSCSPDAQRGGPASPPRFPGRPYSGRTAASTVADINSIIARYGSHAAFYRDTAHGNRGAYYVFESLRIADWTALD